MKVVYWVLAVLLGLEMMWATVFAISYLWNHFPAAVFGLPLVTWPQVLGTTMILALLRPALRPEVTQKEVVYVMLLPWVSMGIGWLLLHL